MTVVESAPVAMILIDPRDEIALANRLAEAIFGYGAGEMTGRPAEILMPERVRDVYLRRRREMRDRRWRIRFPASDIDFQRTMPGSS